MMMHASVSPPAVGGGHSINHKSALPSDRKNKKAACQRRWQYLYWTKELGGLYTTCPSESEAKIYVCMGFNESPFTIMETGVTVGVAQIEPQTGIIYAEINRAAAGGLAVRHDGVSHSAQRH